MQCDTHQKRRLERILGDWGRGGEMKSIIFGNSCGSKNEKQCHLNWAFEDDDILHGERVFLVVEEVYTKREREREMSRIWSNWQLHSKYYLRHVLFGLYLIRKFHVKLDSPDSFIKTEDLAIIFPHSHMEKLFLGGHVFSSFALYSCSTSLAP